MLVVGDKEMSDNKVSVRLRSGERSSQIWASFKAGIGRVISSRSRELGL
jgi:threonyl-tRNA synthetase